MTISEITAHSGYTADEERLAIRMIGDVFDIVFLDEPFTEFPNEVYKLFEELDPEEAAQVRSFATETVAHGLLA